MSPIKQNIILLKKCDFYHNKQTKNKFFFTVKLMIFCFADIMSWFNQLFYESSFFFFTYQFSLYGDKSNELRFFLGLQCTQKIIF
jgi:hypothetical protein